MIERRTAGQPIELRQSSDAVSIVGHASVFNAEVVVARSFREVISPGAFAEAIERRDAVSLLIDHLGLALATTVSGTLKLSEDAIGLRIASELDLRDPDVQRIVPKLERGDLRSMSFAFVAEHEEWIEGEGDELPLRIIRQVRLFDVSLVDRPAYPTTDVSLS